MKTNRLTIYDIKYRVTNAPHFFDRKTLKFFGQTLKSFTVRRCNDANGKPRNVWFIESAIFAPNGAVRGFTRRWFNGDTNTLHSTVPDMVVAA